jgi:V/A-type H+-transporting ATPase subunit B
LLEEKVEFSIVFAAMGVKHDVAEFFIRNFQDSGALVRAVMVFSLADAPSVERLLTPRVALTLAEHLAFDCSQHVLVLLTDMTNYCESLREVGTARGEIPGRKAIPAISTRTSPAFMSAQAASKVRRVRSLKSDSDNARR